MLFRSVGRHVGGAMTALLSATALVAGFHGRPPVLDGATVEIHEGRRVALLGANGSGKTTLLRCLSGALKPHAGEIRADGQPVGHRRLLALRPAGALGHLHRRHEETARLGQRRH